MTGDAEPPESRSAAERGLDEHLALLRAAPPSPSPALSGRVARTARWQGVARAPLRVAALIAGALIDGLGRLIGTPDRGQRR